MLNLEGIERELRVLKSRVRLIEVALGAESMCRSCGDFPAVKDSELCPGCLERSGGCLHDWCYSPIVIMTYPARYRKICRKCGKIESERGKTSDIDEFDNLVKEFAEKSQKTDGERQSERVYEAMKNEKR